MKLANENSLQDDLTDDDEELIDSMKIWQKFAEDNFYRSLYVTVNSNALEETSTMIRSERARNQGVVLKLCCQIKIQLWILRPVSC